MNTPTTPTAPGRVSTGAHAPAAAATIAPDLHCWVRFVPRPQDAYDGEYGFDWIKWQRDPKRRNDEMTKVVDQPITTLSHCYDALQQQYLPVVKDLHLRSKLQAEYQRLVIYGEDYYAGWLSLRPGQEVKLWLSIEALNNAPLHGDYLTFGAHANYQVTVNGQVNQAIRLVPKAGSSPASPQIEDVTIKCLHACADTALRVLDEKGQLVGQLNVIGNARTYHLPVRVVYLVKDGPGAAASLATLQASFTSINLKYYLNSKSLQQAQIQVEFEKTNQVHQLVFKQAEWAGKFYNVAGNWLTDYIVRDPKTKTIKQYNSVLDKIMADYVAKYEKGVTPFRGILLVITDLQKDPAENQGGVSKIRPVNFRGALIFKTNIDDQGTYAHEIGHALGLDHTFYQQEVADELAGLVSFISPQDKYLALLKPQRKGYLDKIKAYQEKTKQDLAKLAGNRRLSGPEKQQIEQDIQFNKKSIEGYQNLIILGDKYAASTINSSREAKVSLATFAANPFKFNKGSTDNFMDYIASRTRFLHWQWKVMQRDVATYYGR